MTATLKKKKSTATRNQKVARFIAGAMELAFSPLGRRRRESLLSLISEAAVPEIEVDAGGAKPLKFWCFGGWSFYRAVSVLEKEPLTIRWIDTVGPGSVFWDIGANIGVYSLYASVVRQARVYAFEPSLMNIFGLIRNVERNRVDHLVSAFPVALSERSGMDDFNMSSTAPGNTGGQFSHQPSSPAVFRQACLSFSIDDFISTYGLPAPEYMVIPPKFSGVLQ